MAFLIKALIFLVLASLLGYGFQQDPGYILLAWQAYTVEMPLWLLMVLLTGIGIIIWALLKVVLTLLHLPSTLKDQWQAYRQTKTLALAKQALEALLKGEWAQAENHLKSSASFSPYPWLHYVAAAFAAHQNKNFTVQALYLEQATRNGLPLTLLPWLRVHLNAGVNDFINQFQALQTMQTHVSKTNLGLRFLIKYYKLTANWQALEELLIKAQKKLPSPTWLNLSQQVYTAQLKQVAPLGEAAILNAFKNLPAKMRQDPLIIKNFIKHLYQLNALESLRQYIPRFLKKNWNETLVYYFGLLPNPTQSQLKMAESWLTEQPHNATLLLTLAKICQQLQLWGQARDYALASIQQQSSASAYLILGDIMQYLSQGQESQNYYKEGLELMLNHCGV